MMDPDACLAEIRQLTAEVSGGLGARMDRAERLAELVEALDGWLSRGGFLPRPWRQARLDPAEQR